MPTFLFSLCAGLWISALFIANLTAPGRLRARICGLLRLAALLALLALRVFLQMSGYRLEGREFHILLLLCGLTACGHFFASDFTVYLRERTPSAAKSAMMTASATILLLVGILALGLTTAL